MNCKWDSSLTKGFLLIAFLCLSTSWWYVYLHHDGKRELVNWHKNWLLLRIKPIRNLYPCHFHQDKPIGQEIVRNGKTLKSTLSCPKNWFIHPKWQCFKHPGVSFKWEVFLGATLFVVSTINNTREIGIFNGAHAIKKKLVKIAYFVIFVNERIAT